MSQGGENEVNVLKLTLHGKLIGYLTGYLNGRNVLSFASEYRQDSLRPTLSLITHPKFPRSAKFMAEPLVRSQRLHPILSNLMPEGSLREYIAHSLKVHVDNEFHIFSYLGRDLPGALMAEPLDPEEVPRAALNINAEVNPVKFGKKILKGGEKNRFSLAGVQMKFSMKKKDGRYNLPAEGELGDWIVKTPSTQHKDVPLNEYSSMSLAAMVGVNIPDIKLVALDKLVNLPPINLPQENLAFAIKRFDREEGKRIHMEDFAQVFVKYPHEKYNTANYEQIARVLYLFSGDGLADAQQLARRLLVNVLLANGDAHLKNWSLIYMDKITPRLSPSYDIVTTGVYVENERQFALNLGKTKDWYQVSLQHFQYWSEHSDIPWRAIRWHLNDVMEKARTLWPEALKNLPMNENHKQWLRNHWKRLNLDFRIA